MSPVPELPSGLRGFVLIGKHGATFVPIATDADGQLYALLRGALESGGFGTVALDDDGQIMAVLRGASGYNVDVDSSGFLTAMMRGGGPLALYGPNLLIDADFEIVGVGGKVFDGSWNETTTAGTIEAEGTFVFAGSYSAKLTRTGGGNIFLRQAFTVVPGATMEIRFRAAGDGSAAPKYGIRDVTNAAWIVPVTSCDNAAMLYQEVIEELTVPASCVSIQLFLLPGDDTDDVAYFDNAEARLQTAAAGATGSTLPVGLDSRGQVVMVLRGLSGNYADIDAEGNISAMLKALYGTTPTGVACDVNGRLKFFLTDDVDQWGEYLEVGNAELAARVVGCPVSYDRRGQVLYRTDFSDGQGAWQLEDANGGAAAMQATAAIQGTNCVALSTAAAANSWAKMYLSYPVPVSGESVGVGVYFSYFQQPAYWLIWLQYSDGTTVHFGELLGKVSDGKLYVYDDEGSEVEVGTWDNGNPGLDVWHYAKLVMDLSTGAYIRAIFDGVEIDLSGINYYQDSTSDYKLVVTFGLTGRAASIGSYLVDCPIITVRE